MDNRRQPDQGLIEHQLYEERRLLEIETNIKGLEDKIDKLSKDVSGLVSAWEATAWLVGAVKWISGIAVACAALYTIFKR
jgi:hypothetical protein